MRKTFGGGAIETESVRTTLARNHPIAPRDQLVSMRTVKKTGEEISDTASTGESGLVPASIGPGMVAVGRMLGAGVTGTHALRGGSTMA